MPVSDIYRRRAREAVDALFSFRPLDPWVRDFVRDQPLKRIKPGFDEVRLRLEIYQALVGEHPLGDRIELEVLVEYLDHLQKSGKTHIFLLSLPEEELENLEILKDEELFKQRLRDLRLGNRYNQNHWVYDTGKKTKLAAAWHEPGARLLLKWVETRTWQTQKAGKKQNHRQRAVSFFHLDLVSGDGELRIQELRGTAQPRRRRAFQSYLRRTTTLLDCDAFELLPLAPAIRRALSEGGLDLLRTEVILRDGGTWKGGKGAVCSVAPEELAAVVQLKYNWQPPPGGSTSKVPVLVDGHLDEVRIFKPCTRRELSSILGQVRRWYRDAVVGEPLSPVGGDKPEGGGQLSESQFERLLRVLKEAVAVRPEPGLETATVRSLEAIREYLESHREETAAAKDPNAEGKPRPMSRASRIAIEQFLKHVERVAESDDEALREETRQLRRDERWIFWLFVAIAMLGLAIVTAGAILLLGSIGDVTIGAISGLVGVLTTGLSLLVRRNSRRLERQRRALEERRQENLEVLLAIQAALAIPDRTRSVEAMSETAKMLRERAKVA